MRARLLAPASVLMLLLAGCPDLDEGGPDGGAGEADAGASIFSATCTGTVAYYVDDGSNAFGGQIGAGDPITMTYAYDLGAPRNLDGSYTVTSPPSGITVSVEGWTIAPASGVERACGVFVVDSDTEFDGLGMLCLAEAATAGLPTPADVAFGLRSSGPTALTTQALPTFPFPIGAPDTNLRITKGAGGPWEIAAQLTECH